MCADYVTFSLLDVKATALLKLVYLEMLGYDMSWASFHVLEVMSSPKYHQKRVGYLGAVQSFRPDTEVLMLATNLLKKDIGSSTQTVISLPIATLPHVITPSLALSTLPDLLPRLGHSHSNIRKKTLVTLYRLALVYPEALRAAWPKIKERLLDPNEDPSVTAAIVNVVCELGWRRPHDFLPLAPRLFELLVDGGNNWMAIKLIKLFATLTPLEPRLVRKLLPPLTNIIATTPAMSLLYECINGIIQGGILGSTDDTADADEIATLCVKKLRGMVMINGDPNLKYVALLAFNKIVATHPHLVAEQDDVILDCLDSPDITIRIQALDLVQGIVTGDNLIPVVSRLMKQLKSSAPTKERSQPGIPSFGSGSDSNDEAHVAITEPTKVEKQAPPLPEDYMIDIIRRILFICSKDNYSNVLDFDWYIDVLTQLVRMAPVPRQLDSESTPSSSLSSMDVSGRIGDELRNVAVKVRAMRSTAVSAGFTIVAQLNADTPTGHKVTSGVLSSVAWLLGEYAILLQDPDGALNSLLQLIPRAARPEVCATSLLAVTKIFATIAGDETRPWTAEWKSRISLLIARILHGAQRNVPMAEGLDLDEPIHSNLTNLLSPADLVALDADESDEFEVYYSQRPAPTAISSSAPAISRLADPIDETIGSYQQPASEESYLDADIIARRKAERLERNKDDSYYLPSDEITRESTPIHNILQTSNGPDLDIDSIPIIQLDRDNMATPTAHAGPRPQAKPRQKIVIASDETLEGSDGDSIRQHDSGNNSDILTKAKSKKAKHSLLQVDSSHIGSFSLEGAPANGFDYERKQREEAEMQQAIKEVERLRLEMQRANERIQVAHGVDAQGTIVKKKRTVKKTAEGALGPDGEMKPKKKKKKKVNPAQEPDQTPDQGSEGVGTSSMADTAAADSGAGVTADDVVLPKKKKKTVKKKKMAEIEDLS
ncbi:AP-3 complex subunit delta [Metarhizium anisopliae]